MQWELWVFGHFVIIRFPLKELANLQKWLGFARNPLIISEIIDDLQHISTVFHFLFTLKTNHNHFRKSNKFHSQYAHTDDAGKLTGTITHFHTFVTFPMNEHQVNLHLVWPKSFGPWENPNPKGTNTRTTGGAVRNNSRSYSLPGSLFPVPCSCSSA